MESRSVTEIPADAFAKDLPFRARYRLIDEGLDGSVSALGVVFPLHVTADAPHRIISGHKRYAAAVKAGIKKMPAVLHDQKSGPKDLFLLSLLSNWGQTFGGMDCVFAAGKAAEYGFSPKEIREKILPLLGLEPHKKNLEELMEIGGMHLLLKEALADGSLPMRGASLLCRFTETDQQTFARGIAAHISLTSSQLMQAAEWLQDLISERSRPLDAFLGESGLASVLSESGEDKRRKADQFLKKLRKLRFPRQTALEEKFFEAARGIEEDGLKIEAPAFFEDQGLTVKLKARSPGDLNQLIKTLGLKQTSINSLFEIML